MDKDTILDLVVSNKEKQTEVTIKEFIKELITTNITEVLYGCDSRLHYGRLEDIYRSLVENKIIEGGVEGINYEEANDLILSLVESLFEDEDKTKLVIHSCDGNTCEEK